MPKARRASGRRLGWQHQKLRTQMLPYAYGQPCHFCQQPMLPGQKLDLDHTDNRRGYRGMTHASCNRADGAHKTNTILRAKTDPRSRDW